MKTFKFFIIVLLAIGLANCSGGKEKKESKKDEAPAEQVKSDTTSVNKEMVEDSDPGEPVPGAEIYLEQEPTGGN